MKECSGIGWGWWCGRGVGAGASESRYEGSCVETTLELGGISPAPRMLTVYSHW